MLEGCWARMVRLLSLVWLAVIFASPAIAQTPPASETELESAEHLYATMDYEQALAGADRTLATGGLRHDLLVRATRLQAFCQAALGNSEAAQRAATLLFAYDRDFQIPSDLSPKIAEPLKLAKLYWRDQPIQPGLDVTATVSAASSDPSVIRVTTRDPTHLARDVAVSHRWGGAGSYTRALVKPGQSVEVAVGARPAGSARLDYYAQALDAKGDVVFEAGLAAAPKTALSMGQAPGPAKPLQRSEGGSIFSSPVFWIVTGVVLAGAATGAYFALRPKDRQVETMPASGVMFVPAVGCGGGSCN